MSAAISARRRRRRSRSLAIRARLSLAVKAGAGGCGDGGGGGSALRLVRVRDNVWCPPAPGERVCASSLAAAGDVRVRDVGEVVVAVVAAAVALETIAPHVRVAVLPRRKTL